MIAKQKLFFVSVILCGFTNVGWAAPISFNTALPVAKDAYINREQLVIKRFNKGSTALKRNLEVTGVVSVIGYGVTPKLAIFAAIPYFDKSMQLSINGSTLKRSTRNVNDIRLFARYTLLQQDKPSETLRLAAFAGVDSATAKDNRQDNLGILPQPLQSGSGSVDSFAGIVVTYQTLDYELDAQISYQNNSAKNNFQFGDILKVDASFQYRLLPFQLSADTNSFTYAVIELNLINQQQHQAFSIKDINSGGTTAFISPGIQYVTAKYIVEAAIQIPVAQNLNGNALEVDYIFTTGFRVNF